jgi:hypothetical protein
VSAKCKRGTFHQVVRDGKALWACCSGECWQALLSPLLLPCDSAVSAAGQAGLPVGFANAPGLPGAEQAASGRGVGRGPCLLLASTFCAVTCFFSRRVTMRRSECSATWTQTSEELAKLLEGQKSCPKAGALGSDRTWFGRGARGPHPPTLRISWRILEVCPAWQRQQLSTKEVGTRLYI